MAVSYSVADDKAVGQKISYECHYRADYQTAEPQLEVGFPYHGEYILPEFGSKEAGGQMELVDHLPERLAGGFYIIRMQ